MKRMIQWALAAILTICSTSAFTACSNLNNADGQESQPARIGIAWRCDSTSLTYVSTVRSVREAGAIPVPLPQFKSPVMAYDGDQLLPQYTDAHGVLRQEYADALKADPLAGQDIASVLTGLDAVIFTGGSDISPTLYKTPEPWHGIDGEGNCDAHRDVSDYILMSWCLEREERLPVLCICRGMQMLAIVSGATMIQDLRTYFHEQGLSYNDEHRTEPTADHGRDFATHDVNVTDASSLLRKIVGSDVIKRVPSWHHQALRSVEGTPLKVTAVAPTAGIDIIEGIERTDKPFFIGLQYHPEVAVAKHADGANDASRFMSYDDALRYFRALINKH